MLDLVLPLQCGGCDAAATAWCEMCDRELRVRPDEPHLVTPRLDPGVPVLSLGRYAGARRRAIVALKEHGRRDLEAPLAHALHTALDHLVSWGLLDEPFRLVPAPTRRTAARRRGGDPVTRIARRTGHPTTPALRLKSFTRDSVGLSSAARQRNVAGKIRLTGPIDDVAAGPIVLVDDVVTTGATATESVRTLQTAGGAVVAVVVLANA